MNKYKTVFISDIHLGTKMSQANQVLEFIKTFECEKLYLVGDIIDGWALYKSFYWPQTHNDVIQKLMRLARKGTEVVYIPGNHDEFLRSFGEHDFGNIKLIDKDYHIGVDGKKYLVIHGDQFDIVIEHAKWLSHFGSWAYDVSIVFNTFINKIRNVFKLKPWSISSWLKYKVKKAINFIGDYENTLSNYAKSVGCDGIVCGHIHHPNRRDVMGIAYLNCGDWVETCSAIVEHMDGTMEVILWKK
jgi:UDP-2,3-diacylglucosamine pyrophosphatase LpxH